MTFLNASKIGTEKTVASDTESKGRSRFKRLTAIRHKAFSSFHTKATSFFGSKNLLSMVTLRDNEKLYNVILFIHLQILLINSQFSNTSVSSVIIHL